LVLKKPLSSESEICSGSSSSKLVTSQFRSFCPFRLFALHTFLHCLITFFSIHTGFSSDSSLRHVLTTCFYSCLFVVSLALQPPNLGLGLPPCNSPFHFGLLDLRHSVGLPGRVISSSQHKHRKTHTNTKQPFPEWDSNQRSRLPSERRQCTP
jgi:hypothetical protein